MPPIMPPIIAPRLELSWAVTPIVGVVEYTDVGGIVIDVAGVGEIIIDVAGNNCEEEVIELLIGWLGDQSENTILSMSSTVPSGPAFVIVNVCT